jgi:cytochrome c
MDDRNNTIAGWVLFAGIVGLGAWVVTGQVFAGEHPEKGGWHLEGGDEGATAEAVKPIEFYLASADTAAGENVFKKCVACHTVNPGGASGLGPNLHGIVGKPHAASGGFTYSEALKGKPGNWDWKALDEWLTSPRAYAPGTKMTFAGLASPQDRANVIAYMNAQGSNLPLPAAPAEDPAAAEDKAAAEAAGDNAQKAEDSPVVNGTEELRGKGDADTQGR